MSALQHVGPDDEVPREIASGMRSTAMRALLVLARRAAVVDSNVLIAGETGVGKERLARFIHDVSPRGRQPFVAINCGGLPETLLESELFGHARGAFTGAIAEKKGLFEAAAGGTIFLDEIGEMRTDLQVRLLRVLQDREIRRLGEIRARPIDVRVMAATHRQLLADVAQRVFREDLYYRLAVITFEVPPLRERHEDLCSLIDHLLYTLARRLRRPSFQLTSCARDALLTHDWPGNIRELENTLEASCALAPHTTIDLPDLPERMRRPPVASPLADERVRPLWEVEREHILFVLRKNRGNRTHTARQLAIGAKTLYRKLQQYRLQSPDPATGSHPDRPRSE